MITGNSLKFKHISKNTTKLITKILENKNLLRYLYYLDDDLNPLDKQLNEVNKAKIMENNIVLKPFNSDILIDTKIMLFLNPVEGTFRNTSTSYDIYSLDIIVPYKYWVIKKTNELRAFVIAYEIARTIDEKNFTGVGNVKIFNWLTDKVNNEFSGLRLYIGIKSPSKTGVR